MRFRRRAPFPPCGEKAIIRLCEGRGPGASPGRGTNSASCGERYIMPRFERGVAGESPAARSISAWPRSSGLRLLSGLTQVQILPRRPVWRVNPPRRGRCLENRWTGQTDWGARPPLSATFPPVAQKQSSRLIIGRPWCDSKQADHFGGLIPLGGSRGANASGDTSSLRGRTSTLRHCRVV